MTKLWKKSLIISFLLVISVVWSSSSPQILTEDKELQLMKGYSLNLLCQGTRRILWEVITHEKSSEKKESCNSPTADQYICNLIISQVKYEDAGDYICKYNESQTDSLESDSVSVKILGSPDNLKIEPKDQDVFLVNHTYIINCTVNGFPFPGIKWEASVQKTIGQSDRFEEISNLDITNNEEIITTDTFGLFTSISSISFRASESVKYRCTAQNKYGIASATHNVVVSDVPETIMVSKSMTTVLEGHHISLSCIANKYLYDVPIQWRWKPQNAILPLFMDDNKFRKENETPYSYISNITISSIKLQEAGFYFCEVKDIAKNTTTRTAGYIGVERIPFSWNLLAANGVSPRSNFHPMYSARSEPKVTIRTIYDYQNNVILQGSPIHLVCEGEKRVHWTETPAQIQPECSSNRCELKIREASISDSGEYECSDGTGKDRIEIKVEGKPQFTEPQEFNKADILCPLNHLCTVDCTVEGNPLPQIQWEIDGEISKLLQVNTSSYVTQSTISFKPGPSLSSTIRCISNNSRGSIERNFTAVTLEHDEMLEILNINEKTGGYFYEKQSLTVQCIASRYYYENNSISWEKDSKDIGTDFIITESQTDLSFYSEIFKPSATAADAGTYKCKAKTINGDWMETVDPILVLNVTKPRIIETNTTEPTLTVNKNTTVRLYCNVIGSPIPQISWHFKSEVINSSSRHRIYEDGKKLEILSVAAEDKGVYECLATNVGGEVKRHFTIKLNDSGSHSTGAIIGITIAVIAVAIIIYFGLYIKKKCKQGPTNRIENRNPSNEQQIKLLNLEKPLA